MVSQSFIGIDAQRWNDIKAAFQANAGVTIATDDGTAESHGVHFSWCYDGDSLAVTVDSVSWTLKAIGMTEQAVLSKFAAWIKGVQ